MKFSFSTKIAQQNLSFLTCPPRLERITLFNFRSSSIASNGQLIEIQSIAGMSNLFDISEEEQFSDILQVLINFPGFSQIRRMKTYAEADEIYLDWCTRAKINILRQYDFLIQVSETCRVSKIIFSIFLFKHYLAFPLNKYIRDDVAFPKFVQLRETFVKRFIG